MSSSVGMHIGIDVDGVLRKLLESIRREFIKDHPETESQFRDSVDGWGVDKLVKGTRLDDDVETFAFANPDTSYRCFRNADPFSKAISSITRFYVEAKKRDCVVSICTSQPNPWQREATIDWLHENNVPFDNAILTGTGKGHFCLDFHLDDKEKNCLDVSENGGTGYLMKRPYNNRRNVANVVDSIDEFRRELFES